MPPTSLERSRREPPGRQAPRAGEGEVMALEEQRADQRAGGSVGAAVTGDYHGADSGAVVYGMERTPINIRDKLAEVLERGRPRSSPDETDYHFKWARLEGDFVWH